MPETGGFEENLLSHADFIKLHTIPGPALLRPDIVLYLASVITPLWQASERFLEAANMDPPFWAFAWPGSEALGAHIGACPALVRGKRVLDFAAGGGLAAIAAAKAGAARVEAADIDALAREAIGLNAALNGVDVRVMAGDVVGAACRWDVILCGDVSYEAPMARHILPWLRDCAGRAADRADQSGVGGQRQPGGLLDQINARLTGCKPSGPRIAGPPRWPLRGVDPHTGAD